MGKRGVRYGLGVVLLVGVAAGLVAWLAWGAEPAPAVSGLVTARGIGPRGPLGETSVFAVGERVYLVYTLHQSRAGATLGVRLTLGGAPVSAPEARTLAENERGVQALLFVPRQPGDYRAVLLLNGAAVADAAVAFKVALGGAHLHEVATARGVDPASFKPLDETSTFAVSDTVHLTYRVVDARAGDTLRVRYSIAGQQQPPDPHDSDLFSEGGSFRGYFSVGGRGGWLVPGSYRAELWYNNDLEAVALFEVRPNESTGGTGK